MPIGSAWGPSTAKAWKTQLRVVETQLEEDPPVPASRTMLRVECTFRFLSAFVPKRQSDEEIGEALEVIGKQLERSPARLPVYRLVAITVFWVLVNAIRYRVATLLAGPVARKRTLGE